MVKENRTKLHSYISIFIKICILADVPVPGMAIKLKLFVIKLQLPHKVNDMPHKNFTRAIFLGCHYYVMGFFCLLVFF